MIVHTHVEVGVCRAVIGVGRVADGQRVVASFNFHQDTGRSA
jgi:hypothetical protein